MSKLTERQKKYIQMVSKKDFTFFKNEAIKLIREVQKGNFNRNRIKDRMPLGKFAEEIWDKSIDFSYGMEYGYIMGLMEMFNLSKEDL